VFRDAVEAFLYARRGGRFCSGCIGKATGLTSKEAFSAVNAVRIHRRQLRVDLSACTTCGRIRAIFWIESDADRPPAKPGRKRLR